MHRLVYVLCLVVSLPISAHATSNITNTSCAGSLTSSLVDGSSFACACNSSIGVNQVQPSKASLNSVLGRNQTPSGVLTLNGGGSIYLVNPSGVTVQTNNTPSTQGGSLVISSGSGSGGLVTTGNNTYILPISLSAVPEPSSYLMVLLGIGFITYRRQLKH